MLLGKFVTVHCQLLLLQFMWLPQVCSFVCEAAAAPPKETKMLKLPLGVLCRGEYLKGAFFGACGEPAGYQTAQPELLITVETPKNKKNEPEETSKQNE